jgi:hypothetical protein
MSLIPAANLPPVSLNWCQIMGILTDCWHLKVNLKSKFIYMLTPLIKGAKKIKRFSDWRFFDLPPVSTTPVVHLLSCETVLIGYSGAGGKLIHVKNLKSKISWHCTFKPIYFMLAILFHESPLFPLLGCIKPQTQPHSLIRFKPYQYSLSDLAGSFFNIKVYVFLFFKTLYPYRKVEAYANASRFR